MKQLVHYILALLLLILPSEIGKASPFFGDNELAVSIHSALVAIAMGSIVTILMSEFIGYLTDKLVERKFLLPRMDRK